MCTHSLWYLWKQFQSIWQYIFKLSSPPLPPGDFYLVSIAGIYETLGKLLFWGAEDIMCLFVAFLAKLVNISGALFIAP